MKFWGDYVLIATYLINKLPSPLLGNLTPYQTLLGPPPSYHHLRSFGCLCYASTLIRNRSKFDPRAKACIFLGYPFGTKGYASSLVQSFFHMILNQFKVSIKVLRTDNGPKIAPSTFYASKGILHQLSCVETPQQNAVVERKH